MQQARAMERGGRRSSAQEAQHGVMLYHGTISAFSPAAAAPVAADRRIFADCYLVLLIPTGTRYLVPGTISAVVRTLHRTENVILVLL